MQSKPVIIPAATVPSRTQTQSESAKVGTGLSKTQRRRKRRNEVKAIIASAKAATATTSEQLPQDGQVWLYCSIIFVAIDINLLFNSVFSTSLKFCA